MDDDNMISVVQINREFTKPTDEEEEEEALSLCDFPLITSDASADQEHHNSASQPSDFFEFFNDLNSENIICSHAEDMISCGKLVPYKLRQKPLFDEQILKSVTSGYDDVVLDYSSRRYCESLPERPMMRSNSGGTSSTRLTRSSRSLDSRYLRSRNSSLVMKSDTPSEMHRCFSLKPRRRYYAFMFGLLKFPAPEMDLQDMKNRQVRQSVLAAVEGGGAYNKRISDRRNSWGDDLLRVLSCKKDASVAVMPSINGHR